MDILLAEFPGLEIESCAGGGGRIDLGMMERAVRVWGSDCIDPLERLGIEAGTSLLLPPELVGSHVASTTSHTTGRTLNLTLRASTAMFSHMGIEWNLLEAAESERRELAAWIALHKKLRPLLHTGRTFHADHPDAGWRVRGVVSDDGSDAVFLGVVAARRDGSGKRAGHGRPPVPRPRSRTRSARATHPGVSAGRRRKAGRALSGALGGRPRCELTTTGVGVAGLGGRPAGEEVEALLTL